MNRKLLVFLLLAQSIISHTQTVQFAYPLGGSGSDLANDVVILSDNSIVQVGRFANSFTPSPEGTTINSFYAQDAYVVKYNATGTGVWYQQYTGYADENIISVCADEYDNIYILGTFDSQLYTYPDSLGYAESPQTGATDLFISKLTTNGEIQWSKALSGSGNDLAGAIECSPDGYIYITGGCNGNCYFNPDNYSVMTYDAVGSSDAFIAKYDMNGALLWFEGNGGPGADVGSAIAFQSDGTVVCSGRIEDVNISEDCFISTLTPGGVYENTWFISGTGNTLGRSLVIDNDDNIYVSGYITGSADFDLSTGTEMGTAIGGYDMFVSKYNASGGLQWYNIIGSLANDVAQDIAISAANELIVSGYINNQCNVNPAGSPLFYNTNGQHDAFLGYYSLDGIFNSGQYYGSAGIDYINRIDTREGKIAACGAHAGTVDFEWGVSEYIVNSTDDDGFVVVFDLCNQELINTFTITNNTAVADQDGAQYQWINCSNTEWIEGETNQSFTPSQSGVYSVQVQIGNCFVTSSCENITVTGVDEIFNPKLEVSPNPALNEINIPQSGHLYIYNSTGQLVLENTAFNGGTVDLQTFVPGAYSIILRKENTTFTSILIKH